MPTRKVDDDTMAMLELDNGATGTLCASQVCAGRENGLRLRIYGTEGGIEWDQEHPNDLTVRRKDQPSELRRASNGYLGEAAQSLGRTPAGHPEGYLEGFANIYRAFARAVRGTETGLEDPYPTAADGLRGVQFIETVIQSAEQRAWLEMPV